jgi:hypothetical protein
MSYSNDWSNDSAVIAGDEPKPEASWSPELDADDLLELQAAQQDSSKIISSRPREPNLLGYYSTVCLIFNRMIGK